MLAAEPSEDDGDMGVMPEEPLLDVEDKEMDRQGGLTGAVSSGEKI